MTVRRRPKVPGAVNPLNLDAPYRLREAIEVSGCRAPSDISLLCDWALSKGFDAIVITPEAGFTSPHAHERETACAAFGEPRLILLSEI